MSARELVVLGTASQVPTRHRNHNGYLLRWDDSGILFDPGEGTQRQFTHAGVPASAITTICITHLHGDHCLGLPGMLQRLSLDRVDHPVDLFYPASGEAYIDRLRHASIYDDHLDLRCHPISADGSVHEGPAWSLVARRLDHRVDTVGYQLVEHDRRHMLTDRLAELGISGPAVGQLQREGRIETVEGTVDVAQVSELRAGLRFAFVMDTRTCASAVELAGRADLLVCEATFLERDAALAEAYGHMTAAQAAAIARAAHARRLVLTHFSQRYTTTDDHLAEARRHIDDVVVAHDLARIEVPKRS